MSYVCHSFPFQHSNSKFFKCLWEFVLLFWSRKLSGDKDLRLSQWITEKSLFKGCSSKLKNAHLFYCDLNYYLLRITENSSKYLHDENLIQPIISYKGFMHQYVFLVFVYYKLLTILFLNVLVVFALWVGFFLLAHLTALNMSLRRCPDVEELGEKKWQRL